MAPETSRFDEVAAAALARYGLEGDQARLLTFSENYTYLVENPATGARDGVLRVSRPGYHTLRARGRDGLAAPDQRLHAAQGGQPAARPGRQLHPEHPLRRRRRRHRRHRRHRRCWEYRRCRQLGRCRCRLRCVLLRALRVPRGRGTR